MYWDRFDIVEAHYCFYVDHHNGQDSPEHKRLCRILRYFRPRPTLCYDSLSENGQVIYDNLTTRKRV